jgi:hypothetical protein
MGLDWVVLAREEGQDTVQPTEVLGAKRATDNDDDVINRLRDIWAGGEKGGQSFDEFLTTMRAQEVPPIVIGFGPDAQAAVPAVRAEGQYYGFRAQALDPQSNSLSAWAAKHGQGFNWLYQPMAGESQINEGVQELAHVLGQFRSAQPDIAALGDQYYTAWQSRQRDEELERQVVKPELQELVFDVFAYLGAIAWLTFWSTKGFKIAPEY